MNKQKVLLALAIAGVLCSSQAMAAPLAGPKLPPINIPLSPYTPPHTPSVDPGSNGLSLGPPSIPHPPHGGPETIIISPPKISPAAASPHNVGHAS